MRRTKSTRICWGETFYLKKIHKNKSLFAGREKRRKRVGVGLDGEEARLMVKTRRVAGLEGEWCDNDYDEDDYEEVEEDDDDDDDDYDDYDIDWLILMIRVIITRLMVKTRRVAGLEGE